MFNHPSQSVLQNLELIGSKVYRTDIHGEIEIIVDKNGSVNISTCIK